MSISGCIYESASVPISLRTAYLCEQIYVWYELDCVRHYGGVCVCERENIFVYMMQLCGCYLVYL